MSTGAIGGVGSVPEFVDPEGGAAAEATEAQVGAPAQAPEVVRGTRPEAIAGDGAATLVQAQLEARVSDGETGEKEATALEQSEATEATEAPRSPEEIQAELEALEALEAVYEEWLEDPELTSYERYFIEMDLYDVRSEIFDLKVELGAAIADQWWNSFGLLGAGLLDSWDAMISLFQTKSQGMIRMLDQQQLIVERGNDEAKEAERRRQIQAAIRRAAAESGALVPPVSSEILAILDRHRDAVERFAEEPSRERLPALREAIRALTDHGQFATKERLDGIVQLIRSFQGQKPGMAYLGKNKGWVNGNEVEPDPSTDFAPYADVTAMARRVVREVITSAPIHRRGFGGMWHVINHAAALVDLAEYGYRDLAQRALPGPDRRAQGNCRLVRRTVRCRSCLRFRCGR